MHDQKAVSYPDLLKSAMQHKELQQVHISANLGLQGLSLAPWLPQGLMKRRFKRVVFSCFDMDAGRFRMAVSRLFPSWGYS